MSKTKKKGDKGKISSCAYVESTLRIGGLYDAEET